jgi:hypothetical protein
MPQADSIEGRFALSKQVQEVIDEVCRLALVPPPRRVEAGD